MERSKINPGWPNALRWFLAQGSGSFAPWHFILEPQEMEFAASAFRREDIGYREVFVFARRQDCDDFAGLEVVNGSISGEVIYFHPVFGDTSRPSPRDWDIVQGRFEDVFEFVAAQVVPDMKEWALTADAGDL